MTHRMRRKLVMRGASLSTNASQKKSAPRKAREADGHMECVESATPVPVPSGTGSNRLVITCDSKWPDGPN